jgi:hypothetical protein
VAQGCTEQPGAWVLGAHQPRRTEHRRATEQDLVKRQEVKGQQTRHDAERGGGAPSKVGLGDSLEERHAAQRSERVHVSVAVAAVEVSAAWAKNAGEAN